MHPLRQVGRWSLTLLAVLLALVAVLLVALRLALTQVDQLAPRVERLLEARTGATVELREFDAGLARLDPVMTGGGLTMSTLPGEAGLPLLEVEHAQLRLDTAASLRTGVPVVADARLSGLTLHLYQDEQGGWHWPDPARIPPELLEGEFDLERLDFWVGLLLRQRAWVEDVRLVLHGRERRVDMLAPRLLLTGDERRAHLEGEVHLEGQEEATLQAVLEVFPGPTGFRDFSAALQADMKLDTLIDLVEVFTLDDPLRLEDASGDVTLWGRWHRGALADARVDIDVPRLVLRRDDEPIVLEPLRARGQWLRNDEGWEAWLQGDAAAADWAEPHELADERQPALPHFWHMRYDDDEGWWLTTSQFELASLAAWRERILLPEGLVRTIDALEPRGLISGLGVGRRNGHWLAQAALHRVEVEPWDEVPGGGPLDAWVEARDLSGRIEFVGVGDPAFKVPELYPAPMELSHASGEVRWTYEGPRTFVSGRNLMAGWQGAEVEGGFGLAIGGGVHGGLGLDLRFRNADALERPLVDWLPADVLGEELDAWLAAGVAGRVPYGELKLHLPLRRGGSGIEPRLRLDLEIEEGRLPFDPRWPVIEGLEGRLTAGIGTLDAEVYHAESLGVLGRNGRVTIEDDVLHVIGDLASDADGIRRYLRAIPVDGMEQVDDWRGEGSASGRIELSTLLGEDDGFRLDLETDVDMQRLVYLPLEVPLSDVKGPLAWRQRDDDGGLEGRLEGRLFGGPVNADIDTLAGRVELDGAAEVARILQRFDATALAGGVSGRLPWRARFTLGETRNTFRFDSNLQGVAIDLPSPLGKSAGESRPLWVEADLDQQRVEAEMGGDARLRWRGLPWSDIGQGQFWLGRLPEAPSWPEQEGWSGTIYQSRLDLVEWGAALAPMLDGGAPGGDGPGALRYLRVDTACLVGPEDCLGVMSAEARPHTGGGWRIGLRGDLLEGYLDYRPFLAEPLDIALDRLTLDGLLPAETQDTGNLLAELDVPPDPTPLPGWVGEVPNGRLRLAEILYQGRVIGPLTAHWEGSPQRLRVAPLGLTLGQISARGEVIWESAGPGDSLTRSRLDLDGRDLGTALERLGQPVSIRSNETRVRSQLAWPGPPWQFALARSRGSVEAELRNGRFVNLESPTARVVGLLNVDNLVRRLRMDFSDVTGQGTAFDHVIGAATLYGGVLETTGPIRIDGPATSFTLEGTVNLSRRELDQRLGVTVPVSSSLPLAAVIAGAPVVGGALFIADRLFGSAIDRVTRIHYRVRGPWTSPDITLETAE